MHSCATRPLSRRIEHRVVRREALRDVVGVEDGHLARPRQARAPHHRDIGPGDRQDPGRAPGRRRDRADPMRRPRFRHQRMARQEGREMGRDPDGAHAGPAAAMGDAEGLVQVEMRHVRAELSGQAQPEQGVEIGAVHVDLAAGLVDHVADLDDGLLEHAVRGGVCDHQRRQVVGMGLGLVLGLEVGEIDIAVLVAGHDSHRHPGHHRARRIGAVRRARDQADAAPALAAALVIAADHQQPGIFPLAAGVRLQRDGGEARDLAQHPAPALRRARGSLASAPPGRRGGRKRSRAR